MTEIVEGVRRRENAQNVHIEEEPKYIKMAAALIIKGFSVCVELGNPQIKQYIVI